MLKKVILTLLFAAGVHLFCYPQHPKTNDYIVTNQGDTIIGKIYSKDKTAHSRIRFKADGTKNKIDYQAEELRGYSFQGDIYLSKNYRQNVLFLRSLVIGPLSLFAHKQLFFIETTTDSLVQLTKQNQKQALIVEGGRRRGIDDFTSNALYIREDKKYVGILSYIMSDCAGLADEIKTVRFRADEITNLVVEYNRCKTPDAALKVSQNPTRITFRKGIKGGVVSSTVKFINLSSSTKELTYFDFSNNQTSYAAGVFVEVIQNKKLGIQPELVLIKKGASGSASHSLIKNEVSYADFNLLYLQLPLSVNYYISKSELQPYFTAGFVYGKLMSDKGKIKETTYQNWREIVMKDYELGYRGGAGVSIPCLTKYRVGLEYVYERTFCQYNGLTPVINLTHNLSLKASF